jgi:hypothetical protein
MVANMKKTWAVPAEVVQTFQDYCHRMALVRVVHCGRVSSQLGRCKEGFQAFLREWRGRTGCPSFEAELTEWANELAKGCVPSKQAYRDDLLEVLMARQSWLWAKSKLRDTPQEIRRIERMMKRSPSERGRFLACQRRLFGREYDPAVQFREAKEAVVGKKLDFRDALAIFEGTRSEHISPNLRRRLRHATTRGLRNWILKLNPIYTVICNRTVATTRPNILIELILQTRPVAVAAVRRAVAA